MVHFTDVTLRDGLQMEKSYVEVAKKLSLFRLLQGCEFSRIEVTSFVHPKWVPQFKDADDFCLKLFEKDPALETMAFVPNVKGLERLLNTPIPWASAFISVSETFNQKNINQSHEETLEGLAALVERAHLKNRKVRIYVSTVFGCPYEGRMEDSQVLGLLKKVCALNPDEVALSDTIGVATPKAVRHILKMFLPLYPAKQTAMHFHDTYGMAVGCAESAFDMGITHFDGAIGGVGGCPYAKGATGNVASEKLMYLFHRMGAYDNFRWKEIRETLDFLSQDLGLQIHSSLYEIAKRGGELYGIQ